MQIVQRDSIPAALRLAKFPIQRHSATDTRSYAVRFWTRSPSWRAFRNFRIAFYEKNVGILYTFSILSRDHERHPRAWSAAVNNLDGSPVATATNDSCPLNRRPAMVMERNSDT
jgi:hypothetical protein